MTCTDRYFGLHSTSSGSAIAAFDLAVFELLAHRPRVIDHLDSALSLEPNLVSAHCLKGIGTILLARQELLPIAKVHLARAKAAAQSPTCDELALIISLEHATQFNLPASAEVLENRLKENPLSSLFFKLSHALRFMSGDLAAMLQQAQTTIGQIERSHPGYGFTLGCLAFAQEETNQWSKAKRTGIAAVESQPEDSWGLHAVAHVFESLNEPEPGIEWITAHQSTWKSCNNFGFHVAWHWALFELERQNHDQALEIYDELVRPTSTDDFRDVSNAASYLWRLEQEGIDVGSRWQEVTAIAESRKTDNTYLFAALHYLLALSASQNLGAAQSLVESIKQKANDPKDPQCCAAQDVALPIANLILNQDDGGLLTIAKNLPSIGGSHAQRDVFFRTLLTHATAETLPELLKLRSNLKAEDRFARIQMQRIKN